MIGKYPVVRSMITYSIMYPSANMIEQILAAKYSKNPKNFDGKQTMRFFVYGTFVHAPLVHNWINFLGKMVPGRAAGDLVKIAVVDQAIFAPLALSSFYIGLTALEFKAWSKIKEEWKTKVPMTWKKSMFIFPIVQAVNFKYVSQHNRGSFIAVIAFIWAMCLSFWKNQSPKELKS